jgi:hypothetical protein
MEDKSYSHRGLYAEASIRILEKLLENPQFVAGLHSRTAQLSNAFRMAVAVGLDELEKRYNNIGKNKEDGQSSND